MDLGLMCANASQLKCIPVFQMNIHFISVVFHFVLQLKWHSIYGMQIVLGVVSHSTAYNQCLCHIAHR